MKEDNFCFCIIIVVKVNDSNKSFSGEMIASVRRKHSKYSQVLLKRKRFFFFSHFVQSAAESHKIPGEPSVKWARGL